jgi:large subunit ribosomal protein L32
MAVPKKRTSKMKKNLRKSVWKKKTNLSSLKALSLGKSLLTKTFSDDSKSKGFTKKT